MKKFFALFAFAALAVTMASCGGTKTEGDKSGEAPAEAPATEAAAAPEGSENAPAAADTSGPEAEGAAGYDPNDEQIDLPTAMKYCGGLEAMQVKFLAMFIARRKTVLEQLEKDLAEDNIADYTTHIHAVKSTALSVGGLQLSETAKALEMAGHAYQDGNEEEQEMNLGYIKEYHPYVVDLYNKLAEEAKARFGVDEG